MLVVLRFRFDVGDPNSPDGPLRDLGACLDGLGARPGYLSGSVGRSLDDPGLWVLTTSWRDVGSYRRALSSYDVKVQVVPLLSNALDEPSAYEVLAGDGTALVGGHAVEPNEAKPRGGG